MNARMLVGGLVLVLTTTTAGCGSKGDASSGNSNSGVLSLGAAVSLTGSLAREGTLTKEGYELCADVVNDRGGVPVGEQRLRLDIDYQDDTSKPDISAQLVDQFNDKGLKLVLGPYGSSTTEAAAAVVERNQQVMVDSSGADDKIFTKGYRRTFGVLAPASQYASSMIQAINDLADPRPSTIAIISADDGFSKTATEGAIAKAEELGIQIVAEEYVPSGTSDVSSALTKIKSLEPDVIVGSVHLAEGVAIVKQAAELGVRPAGGFAETVAPPVPDFVTSLGSLAENVLGSTQWTKMSSGADDWFGTASEYHREFVDAYDGREPQYHNAQATAACLTFVLAVERAGSTEPDEVREQIAALDEQTFFGTLRFSENGQNLSKPMAVIQIQDGEQVSVWPGDSVEATMNWPAVGA